MHNPDVVISALLPVHRAVAPAHLQAALDSLLVQSRRADEVVIVEDGALEQGHTQVLDTFAAQHPRVVRVALGSNQGAGVANQTGLKRCTGKWVAKVDADDLSVADRFQRQLEAVQRDDVDVCGSAMAEFVTKPTDVVGIRVNPLTHSGIARRMRWNNPINHPTAFYRRDLAIAVGGYPTMRYMQDYDLFARLLAGGARMCNLPDALVLFRAEPQMMNRRRSREIHALERELQRNLRRYGITNRYLHLRNLALRSLVRRLPVPVMGAVHRLVFRRAVSSS